LFLVAGDKDGHRIDIFQAVDVLAAKNHWFLTALQDFLQDLPIGQIGIDILRKPEGHPPGVIGQCIQDGCGGAAVLDRKRPALPGKRFKIIHTIQAGAEPASIALENNRSLTVAFTQHDARRRFSQCVLDHPVLHAHYVTIDPRSATIQQFQRLRMGDSDAGALEHFQGRIMDVFNLIFTKNIESWFQFDVKSIDQHVSHRPRI